MHHWRPLLSFPTAVSRGDFFPDKAIDVMDEPEHVRASSYDTSPDVKEYRKEIEAIRIEKEAAIKAPDFREGIRASRFGNRLG